MATFNSQLKQFKQITKGAALTKHERKQIVRVKGQDLIAFGEDFCFKFRLGIPQVPSSGYQYLSKLSLSSAPIDFAEMRSHEARLTSYLDGIEWLSEVYLLPENTWDDLANCNEVGEQLAVYWDSDDRKAQIAGFGKFALFYDPKSCDPWDWKSDRGLTLNKIPLNLKSFYELRRGSETIALKLSQDQSYVKFYSLNMSLTLPVKKPEVRPYHALLGLAPQFNCLSSDVIWHNVPEAHLYKFDTDGVCYALDHESRIISFWYYKGKPLPTEPLIFQAEVLSRFQDCGLSFALDTVNDQLTRRHGFLNRDALYRGPHIPYSESKGDITQCIHYDTRILGVIKDLVFRPKEK